MSSLAPPPPPIVLIVEDDRDTRELYETVFKLEGFWVANSPSADEAIGQVELLQPDVIITDVGLAGGCDGVGLARRVHQNARFANVPVIAVTGRALSELSPDAEFVEILQKPIYPNELVATTRRVLAASAVLRDRSQKVRNRVPSLVERSERVLRKSERLLEKWRPAPGKATSPMNEDLQAEHARLLEQTRALEAEHRYLEAHPRDLEGHAAHRKRLREQIEELHAHMRRLRAQTPGANLE